jgi:LPXTG-motif cell wall-anchored protein
VNSAAKTVTKPAAKPAAAQAAALPQTDEKQDSGMVAVGALAAGLALLGLAKPRKRA